MILVLFAVALVVVAVLAPLGQPDALVADSKHHAPDDPAPAARCRGPPIP